MRPIHLRLQAFGSYAGPEVVDFTELAEYGLFLVTGPTGGGKTTIFDALTFALFGKLPGDRPLDVRSHHADVDTLTEVELDFDVDGRRHRVVRRPAQDRPKKRGAGVTTMQAEAELYEWTGSGWQGSLTGASPVTNVLTELIGLDVEQFQRVVLLPQGKFAEFLLSDTGKRQSLLRQLFGTGLYDRAAAWLRDEVSRLGEQVREADVELDHHRRVTVGAVRAIEHHLGQGVLDGATIELPSLDEASLDELAALIDTFEPVVAEQRHRHDEEDRQRALVAAASASATDVATRFDRAAALRLDLTGLLARGDEMRDAEHRAAAARRVAPVIDAGSAVRASAQMADESQRRVRARRHTIERALTTLDEPFLDDPMSMTVVIGARRAQLTAQADELVAFASLRDEHSRAVTSSHELESALAQARTAVDALHDELVEIGAVRVRVDKRAGKRVALAEQASTLGAVVERRHRLDQVAELLHQAVADESDSADHERELVTRFATGVAPRLAATLVPGEPCLVCGGVDHPVPARLDAGQTLVDPRELELARAAVDSARAARTLLQAEAIRLSDDLGTDADRFLQLVETELAEVEARLVDAERAVAELSRIDTRLAALQARHAELEERTHAFEVQLAGSEARRQLAADAVARAAVLVEGVDEERIAEQVRVVEQLVRELASWQGEIDAAERAMIEHDRRLAVLAGELATAGLGTPEDAEPFALATEDCSQLEHAVEQYHRDLARVSAALDELAALGIPDERPAAEQLQADAERLDASVALGARRVANLETALTEIRTGVASARSAANASAPLREQLDVTRRVAATCNGATGPGGQRITLETWVLAAELDRVAEAATVHLQRLSNGRYALRRGDAVAQGNRRTGLDLTVFDAHTGRERGPRTLSGGEQFQASLALALGLADVVSRGGTGSGRLFEALFVDEGFGSLDPSALDDAIAALQQLQATGRMVGVITHVEAMKQQLPIGVEVRHRADGRGSTILQDPSRR